MFEYRVLWSLVLVACLCACGNGTAEPAVSSFRAPPSAAVDRSDPGSVAVAFTLAMASQDYAAATPLFDPAKRRRPHGPSAGVRPRTIEERDIRFVRLWFTDVLGTLKSVAIAPAELEGAFAEGIGFDGSVIEGFARVFEADMLAKPDPSTFQVLPWRGERPGTARMFCDITLPDGTPSMADPRTSCSGRCQGRRPRASPSTPTRRSSSSCSSRVGCPGPAPEPIDQAGYFDHVPHGTATTSGARRSHARSMGISVEFSHHEGAPGQNEIDLRYADALSTADNIMTFRTVVKEVALEQGIFATFMPKPFAEHPGSGMHTHLSLFEGDTNAFHEPARPTSSRKDRAGSSSPVCCTTAPRSPPSPTSGSTPTSASGAAARRRLTSPGATTTAPPWSACRCTSRQGQQHPGRGAQHRPGVQPLPGLRGAARRRPQGHRGGLRAAARDRGRRLEPHRRRAPAMGIKPLPARSATRSAMERSELVAETLGEHTFDFFLRNKRAEWPTTAPGQRLRARPLPAPALRRGVSSRGPGSPRRAIARLGFADPSGVQPVAATRAARLALIHSGRGHRGPRAGRCAGRCPPTLISPCWGWCGSWRRPAVRPDPAGPVTEALAGTGPAPSAAAHPRWLGGLGDHLVRPPRPLERRTRARPLDRRSSASSARRRR
jgi:glutamine synthetase